MSFAPGSYLQGGLMDHPLHFNVLLHDEQDHRYVARSEVSSHPYFDKCMSKGFPSSITDYVARDGERFLRSTSKWSEQHLLAFKCLYLDNLRVTRVFPLAFIPADDDVAVQMVRQELSATEDEVRTGKTPMSIGYSFYLELAQVLQRPSSPPEPIPIPQRNLRQSSLESSYQFSPSDSNPSTDSSYYPPGTIHRKVTSVSVLDPVLEATTDTESLSISHAGEYLSNPSQSLPHASRRSQDLIRGAEHMDNLTRNRSGPSGSDEDAFSGKTSSGNISIDSIEEDKLEALSNQMAVTFLLLLAGIEDRCHGWRDRKVSFRWFAILEFELIDSIHPLKPILVILGQVIPSVNDGSFFIESRSTRRTTEWVRRENLPQASLEV
jgi:hypothetical protein